MSAAELARMLWTQSWQIALVALVVWLAVYSFARRRPRLAHALWAVVLIKCLVPPVWSSPVGLLSWVSTAVAGGANATVEVPPQPIGVSYDVVAVEPGASRAHFQLDQRLASGQADAGVSRADVCRAMTCAWLASALLAAGWLMGRYAAFCYRLRRLPCDADHRVVQVARDVAGQLQLKRNVRVSVVDGPIGPLVVGFFRPRVVLPREVVDRLPAEQLRLLVAHELLHVRRGDLLWSMLEWLAVSLWWFHPGVWLMSRMLSRETERSCDEDTLAATRCRPADYARCLISVLEHKHRMQFVPALPGVHPVQITTQRLERIMRTGKGSPCSKIGSWLAMALCGLVLLPGGALVTAQTPGEEEAGLQPAVLPKADGAATEENAKRAGQEQATVTEKSYQVQDLFEAIANGTVTVKKANRADQEQATAIEKSYDMESLLAGPAEGVPEQTGEIAVAKSYDVKDLLKAIVAEGIPPGEKAQQALAYCLGVHDPPIPSTPAASRRETFASPAEGEAKLAHRAPQLGERGIKKKVLNLTPYQFVDGTLVVTATPTAHVAIAAKIESHRKFGFKQFLSEVIMVSSKTRPEWDQVTWKAFSKNNPKSESYAVVEGEMFEHLLSSIRSNPEMELLMVPRMVSMSGIECHCMMESGGSTEAGVDADGKPISKLVYNGVRLDVTALDRGPDSVGVGVRFSKSDLIYPQGEGEQLVVDGVAIPRKRVFQIDTSWEIKPGQAMVLCRPHFADGAKEPSAYLTLIIRTRLQNGPLWPVMLDGDNVGPGD